MTPLTELPLSITHGQPAPGLSEKYRFFNSNIIKGNMEENGFTLTSAFAARGRKSLPESRRHVMRFRHADAFPIRQTYPEIIVINGHMGSESLKMYSGLFRLVCSNGLIVMDDAFGDSVRIRHTNATMFDVLAAAHKLMDESVEKLVLVSKMSQRIMDSLEVDRFAESAASLPAAARNLVPIDLLKIRRPEDQDQDLWTVYNRVQENLLQGGMRITGSNRRTRSVTAIDRGVKLNLMLWQLAQEYL